MIYKFLVICIMFSLNCNSQTTNFIGKTLIGRVDYMCMEVTNGCAGESYFLELTIEQKYIAIRQKTEETITCEKDKITYKNLEHCHWKEANGKIVLQNESTNSEYKFISLKNEENTFIGEVEIYGKLKEIVFTELR